jgi:hypothetical protein
MTTEATNGQPLSWASLNLSEIDTDSTGGGTPAGEVPTGTYKLRLVGSKPNPFPNQQGTTDIDFVITEGQYARKHVFASLPSPGAYSWVPKAAAILVKRLGITQQPGEDLVDTLSRGAANGASLITADVVESKYTDSNGNERQGRPKLQFFSIAAAV